MENEIQNRVKGITKRSAKVLEENTGIQTTLEDEDIAEYIRLVLKERGAISKRDDDLSNG